MPPWRLPKIELPGSVALVSGQGDRFRRNLSVHYGMAWAKVGSPPDFADAGQPREGRLWGIVAHTLCRRPPAAERRFRTFPQDGDGTSSSRRWRRLIILSICIG